MENVKKRGGRWDGRETEGACAYPGFFDEGTNLILYMKILRFYNDTVLYICDVHAQIGRLCHTETPNPNKNKVRPYVPFIYFQQIYMCDRTQSMTVWGLFERLTVFQLSYFKQCTDLAFDVH